MSASLNLAKERDSGYRYHYTVLAGPFPRSVCDAILVEGLAEEHRWVPGSGWTTFHVRNEQGLKHALWLMRLSYLRYALMTVADPRELLERESEALHLAPRFRSYWKTL